MTGRLTVVAVLAAPSAAYAADVVVFVCGKDLCRTSASGKGKTRITRDAPRLHIHGRRYPRAGAGLPSCAAAAVARTRRDAVRRGDLCGRHARGLGRAAHQRRLQTIDYRRYMARADGSDVRHVAASGGRPFAAFFDTTRILREGLTDASQERPDATTVHQGLCVPDPESEQSGTCGDKGP